MPDLTPLEATEKLEEVYKSCSEKYSRRVSDNPEFEKYLSAVRIATSYLRQIAAGEYAPVVHAYWIHKDCNGAPTENHEAVVYAECSNCGHEICNIDQETATCPSCGALMGKDDSHED